MCSIIDNLLGDVKLQDLQTAAERDRLKVATADDESIGSSKLVGGVADNGDTADDIGNDGCSNCFVKASRWTVRRWRANF